MSSCTRCLCYQWQVCHVSGTVTQAAQGSQTPEGISLTVDEVTRNEPVQAQEGALSG